MIPKEPSAVAAPRMATALVSMMAEELIPGVLKPQEARPGITMRRGGLQEARDKDSASRKKTGHESQHASDGKRVADRTAISHAVAVVSRSLFLTDGEKVGWQGCLQ